MGTRSHIAILRKDGKIYAVYCHCDGYPEHNGMILYEHYQDLAKILALIAGGDMNSLGPIVDPDPAHPHSFDHDQRQPGVCVYFGRDRGDDNTGIFVYESVGA